MWESYLKTDKKLRCKNSTLQNNFIKSDIIQDETFPLINLVASSYLGRLANITATSSYCSLYSFPGSLNAIKLVQR